MKDPKSLTWSNKLHLIDVYKPKTKAAAAVFDSSTDEIADKKRLRASMWDCLRRVTINADDYKGIFDDVEMPPKKGWSKVAEALDFLPYEKANAVDAEEFCRNHGIALGSLRQGHVAARVEHFRVSVFKKRDARGKPTGGHLVWREHTRKRKQFPPRCAA